MICAHNGGPIDDNKWTFVSRHLLACRRHAISMSMAIRAVKVVYDRAWKKIAGGFSRKNKIFFANAADQNRRCVGFIGFHPRLLQILLQRAQLYRYCLVAFHWNSLKSIAFRWNNKLDKPTIRRTHRGQQITTFSDLFYCQVSACEHQSVQLRRSLRFDMTMWRSICNKRMFKIQNTKLKFYIIWILLIKR